MDIEYIQFIKLEKLFYDTLNFWIVMVLKEFNIDYTNYIQKQPLFLIEGYKNTYLDFHIICN